MIQSVVVVNDYMSSGGAENVVRDLVSGLRALGIRVELVTAGEATGMGRNPVSYVHNGRAVSYLNEVILREQPQIVHFHNIYHFLSPAVLKVPGNHGVPTVLTAHDHHLINPNPAGLEFARGRSRRADLDQPRSNTRPLRWDLKRSRSIAREVQHTYAYRLRHFERSISEIHCPASYQLTLLKKIAPTVLMPNPVAFSSKLPTRSDRLGEAFVFAGRVEPEKGLGQFIDVAPQEVLDRLVVFGDGSDFQRCKELATARGARVSFRGLTDRDEVTASLRSCAALVFPSLWDEVSPLAVIEALGNGADVLGAAVGGVPELTAVGGGGFLFDPTSPASIVQKCNDILRCGPNRIDAVAVRNRHDPTHMIEATLARYHALQSR